MKKQILMTVVLFSCIALSGLLSACSDSFLDGKANKKGLVITMPDTVYLQAKASGNAVVEINLPEAGNSQYTVMETPTWVAGCSYSVFNGGKTEISLGVGNGSASARLTGEMMLSIETLGLVRIYLVLIPAGTPVANSMGHIPVEGTVSDARYSKEADCMYIVTQNPNRLLIVGGSSITKEVELSRRPNCLAVSEDGKTVAIGHGGIISRIDAGNASAKPAIKEYSVDGEVYSLVLGENGYCYFTFKNDFRFNALDLKTGELNSGYFSGGIFLIKPKGSPVIILGSGSYLIAMVDISIPIPERNKSWMLDFLTGEKVWTTEDGKFTIFSEGQIIQTPSDFSEERISQTPFDESQNYVYTLARLGNNGTYGCLWVDHSAASKRLYTVENLNYGYNTETWVRSYLDGGSYAADRTYDYSEYVVETNGGRTVYPNNAQYAFANREGSMLYIVKKTTHDEKQSLWCVERIKTK